MSRIRNLYGTLGRWYWFWCPACKWKGVRYRNAKKCPACKQALQRMRQAKADER